MLINASERTDIAQYYSEWLMNRVREGWALSRNPVVPNRVIRYRLSPDVVDCIVFCTKNPEPMLRHLPELRERGFSLFFYVTITSYGREIEPRVPAYHRVIESFQRLSETLGRDCVGWRYDPVMVFEGYTAEHHLRAFDEMAAALAPYTNFCIFSFVQLYQKLARTFPTLRPVSDADKAILLAGMGETARRYGLRLQTCGDAHDYTAYGIERSACISQPVIERAIGRELAAPRPRPSRPGCGCLPSGDVGAYDTCPNGCRYCYATRDRETALEHYRRHDPRSPLLFGGLTALDEVVDARQESWRRPFEQLRFEL